MILENHGTLTQNQLDALVALGFNNTAFTISKSPKFMEVLKEKDYFDEEIRRKIASQFMTYSLQNDERLGGLVKRSAAEAPRRSLVLGMSGITIVTVTEIYYFLCI